MAKKQLNATSSPVELRTAHEQLAKAQQEYREVLNAFKNEQGIPVVPSTGAPITYAQEINLAKNIAKKYDYVDFGNDLGTASEGYNVGGETFFVKGLGNNSKTTFSPEAKTTVNKDDAFPVTNTVRPTVTPNNNPKVNNPNQAKIDQSIASDAAPQTANQSPQVERESTGGTSNNTGTRDAQQAGAALESNQRNNTSNQAGIVNQNPNELPVSSNTRSGRLSDEFVREPAVSDGSKSGNKDDAGSRKPSGTAILGFGNLDEITASPDPGSTGNGGVTIGTTESVVVPNKSAGTPNNPNVPERPNILHNYVNWTYKISLYLLQIADYNSMMEGGTIPEGARRYTIAASGGYARTNSNLNLERDFYIEELRFTSIIGNRLQGTATNNFELSMSIAEPYSASFIGEVGTLAAKVNGIDITLAENPFLLEIDFTGYKDDGSMIKSILTETTGGKKYIPVKIIAIDMKIDASGAKYTLNMVPYSFYAYTQKRASLPKDAWVYGETVNDILGENSTGLIGRLNQIENEKVSKDQKQIHPDKYKILFYSFNKLGKDTEELQQSKVAFPTKGGPATIIKNRAILKNEPNKQGYTIKAGTLIKEVIKDLVLVSEYFNTKMKPFGSENNKNSDPAELIKVIPQIKLTNNWDGKRNEYAKEITFHVFNTLLYGENFSNGGLAPIRDWGYSKVYNYIFTGQNSDIINVDVNFNLLYYTKFFTDKNELGLILTDVDADRVSSPGSANPNQFSEANATSGFIGKTVPNEPSRYINASLVAEFFDLKMNNSYADMITLDMDIIGDPDWIPQDSSIRGGPIEAADFNTKLDKHGSIGIDVAGTYAKLQLRTPRDYNDKNGLMDLREDSSLVGGVYQVITVENLFQGGKYTCKLNMVKIPNQEENQKTPNTVTASQFRATESNPLTAGQLDNAQRSNNSTVNTNAIIDIAPNGSRA